LLSWCILILNINHHINSAVQLTNVVAKYKITKPEFVNFYSDSVKVEKEILETVFDQVTSEKENKFGDLEGIIYFLSQIYKTNFPRLLSNLA